MAMYVFPFFGLLSSEDDRQASFESDICITFITVTSLTAFSILITIIVIDLRLPKDKTKVLLGKGQQT